MLHTARAGCLQRHVDVLAMEMRWSMILCTYMVRAVCNFAYRVFSFKVKHAHAMSEHGPLHLILPTAHLRVTDPIPYRMVS